MQTGSIINSRFASRPSFSSIDSKKEETKIPEDIEFDIRCLNMFNLFFGLKRAVFTKRKTATGPRDLFEEFEKSFMASMKVLSCKAFDVDSSITKRYCKLIDDVLILNKYVRHNPKKVKKISKDLLNALDKNLNPLKDFWRDQQQKEEELKKLKDLRVVKKSLYFEPLSSKRKSHDIIKPKENDENTGSNTARRSEPCSDKFSFIRRSSVEKYPKYHYRRGKDWSRETKSGQKSSREYFKHESEKFRSNIQKKITFGDLGSAIKPLADEEDPFTETNKEMQLISMISIDDESITGEDMSANEQSFNQKLDVSLYLIYIIDLLCLWCYPVLRIRRQSDSSSVY